MSAESVTGCWQAAVQTLAAAGVETVFGLPGDDLEALAAVTAAGLGFTLCRDQRNAAFMATGYALQSGRPGVAVVGKGPAVTNTVTGLLEARSSAAPVLLLAGGTALEQRTAGAFQELDQLSVVRPLVKWAERVDHPDRLAPLLRRALFTAVDGVPGPVYLELPDHLLTTDFTLPAPAVTAPEQTAGLVVRPDSATLTAVRAARRPIILVGGGMRHRNADRRVERLAEALGAAVAVTASGRGAVDESTPLFAGVAGLYTPEAARVLWADTDCVVSLGSRLEETVRFGWPDALGVTVPVIQVNVSAAELRTELAGPAVIADAGALLDAWLERLAGHTPAADWAGRVAEVHTSLRSAPRAAAGSGPEPRIADVLDALTRVLPGDLVLVQENGLQDMWSYLFPLYACDGGAGSIVPSEQTSLGFGAAAAVGVRRAAPDRAVVALVGDGAFDLFAADLPTAVAEGGILYVVLRNGGYGWLQTQLDQRTAPIPGRAFVDPGAVGMRAPDVPGLHQITVTGRDALDGNVTEAWKRCQAGQVVVLNVPVSLTDALFAGHTAGGDFPEPPERS
ncbi:MULTISPECIES: thiamine pyrophosphate-binding protein [unclassified Micromonospora]|uniref:thiamine pyrophosphate-binding protein n=1 Tax=unclassified Micromonospora TaxID=2617518 RepID=UPI0022B6B646|nr:MULTISPECIES: thiamine pyrophosphate-binding protein [unclassified Micromonospora]MCZ7421942.1 thiamine pyrophosphate-binding protein [Verrucosispora sp. WMMA2121]WBB93323.1 thiamine pyrophosphate-binding protein [Verrucosispora sp. WMMC514]